MKGTFNMEENDLFYKLNILSQQSKGTKNDRKAHNH